MTFKNSYTKRQHDTASQSYA